MDQIKQPTSWKSSSSRDYAVSLPGKKPGKELTEQLISKFSEINYDDFELKQKIKKNRLLTS